MLKRLTPHFTREVEVNCCQVWRDAIFEKRIWFGRTTRDQAASRSSFGKAMEGQQKTRAWIAIKKLCWWCLMVKFSQLLAIPISKTHGASPIYLRSSQIPAEKAAGNQLLHIPVARMSSGWGANQHLQKNHENHWTSLKYMAIPGISSMIHGVNEKDLYRGKVHVDVLSPGIYFVGKWWMLLHDGAPASAANSNSNDSLMTLSPAKRIRRRGFEMISPWISVDHRFGCCGFSFQFLADW